MVAGVDEVTVDGRVVTKHHGGADGARRASVSAVALRAASAAGVRVPAVLGHRGRVLRTALVEGAVSGVALLGEDPAAVLAAVGTVAASLHDVRPPAGLPVVDAGGGWVHGDLCPVNLLVAPDGRATVLDWEDSRVDDPLVDLVWTEWLVRRFHPGATPHLPVLFATLGAGVPPPDRRRAAMRGVLRWRARVEPDTDAWRRHLAALDDLDLSLAG